MGDSVEQWRATIGQWSGGRQHKCVTLQHRIAETSNQIGYKHIRFLVLVSLLVIGCVELNPGPKDVSYVILSNKHKTIAVRWREKRQIIVYLKLSRK